jgi:hypothetical protein
VTRYGVPLNARTIGAVRCARGIHPEDVTAAVLERVVYSLLNEVRRQALLERLASVHDAASRGRPLPVVADDLRRLGEELET